MPEQTSYCSLDTGTVGVCLSVYSLTFGARTAHVCSDNYVHTHMKTAFLPRLSFLQQFVVVTTE